jgi:hypothetical protein
MAGSAATVTVPDESVVEVDISDLPELANDDQQQQQPVVAVADEEPEPAPAPKPKPSRQRATADDAAAALNEAVAKHTQAEEARKAAEATARAAQETALAERRAREEAQRLAAQREQEAQGYREQVQAGELTTINLGIESATRELASAQTELERAMEAGEFAKASAAQVKLSKAAASLDRLEAEKVNYEANATRRPTTEGRVEAPQQPQQSAFERYLSGFDPVAQSWLRLHPECVPAEAGGDRSKNAKMMAGHYDAIAQGLQLNSPDYYRVIEEHAGYRTAHTSSAATTVAAGTQQQDDDGAPAPAPRQPRQQQRQAQPSAPVSRDPPATNGAPSTRQVTLSPAQQEIALLSFQKKDNETDSEFRKRAFGQYAAEFLRAVNDGKLSGNGRGRPYDGM